FRWQLVDAPRNCQQGTTGIEARLVIWAGGDRHRHLCPGAIARTDEIVNTPRRDHVHERKERGNVCRWWDRGAEPRSGVPGPSVQPLGKLEWKSVDDLRDGERIVSEASCDGRRHPRSKR